ncbi:MAG: hypothetical protein ACOYMA_00465 [Bacteroidia bacterium]
MDATVKAFQDYLKSSPLGVSYGGPCDGEISAPGLKAALIALQNAVRKALSEKTDEKYKELSKTFTVLSGDKISASVENIKQILAVPSNPATTPTQEAKPGEDKNIKAIQEMFNSNPFGLSYSGPKDGIMNDQLAVALKQLEEKITATTGASVAGQIVSGNKVLTDSGDLSKTFSLVKSYLKFEADKSKK